MYVRQITLFHQIASQLGLFLALIAGCSPPRTSRRAVLGEPKHAKGVESLQGSVFQVLRTDQRSADSEQILTHLTNEYEDHNCISV